MKIISSTLLLVLLVGCGTTYSWRPSVPEDRRTVSVPTFRNESGLQEMGAVATRQLLREFQREGTFRIARLDDAAVEIQGTIKEVASSADAFNRRVIGRSTGFTMSCKAEITVIDRISGEIISSGRMYSAETTFAAGQDMTTAQRDASGRLADVLARRIVDDVLHLKWNGEAACNKESK